MCKQKITLKSFQFVKRIITDACKNDASVDLVKIANFLNRFCGTDNPLYPNTTNQNLCTEHSETCFYSFLTYNTNFCTDLTSLAVRIAIYMLDAAVIILCVVSCVLSCRSLYGRYLLCKVWHKTLHFLWCPRYWNVSETIFRDLRKLVLTNAFDYLEFP